MSILSIKNIEKLYKKRKVVNGLSMFIKQDEVVGLLGPNGAGKTTCFYIVLGLVKSNGGQVFFDDIDITELAMYERARMGIGYLPQEASIFRKLTVVDNIMAILQLRKNLSEKARYEILDNLLAEFHITHLASHLGISLSGGERRRVEIARALAMDPKFILLDEPFAGLDPISIIDLKRIITQLHGRGIGILITDHNVQETLAICQRAYIVNAGTVIVEGTPQVILQNQKVREVYLGEEFGS